MTRFVGIIAAIAALALAACGGGGSASSTPPTITPSNAPTTSYTAQLIFTGPLAGAQASKTVAIQPELRRIAEGSGSSSPIMIVSAPDANADVAAYGGEVDAVVSPMPSGSPSVSFSQTNTAATIVTPNPSASPTALPSGVIGQTTILGTNAVQVQSAGTATATIGSPVNTTVTTPVYSYMSIALDCYNPGSVAGGTSAGYAAHYGWKWTGTTWTPDDNVADADIYVDGIASGGLQPCVSGDPAGETNIVVHIPGGDTRVSTDTAFDAITASQWANTETSFTINAAIQGNADGSNNGLVIGKTKSGAVFKLFPNSLGTGDGYFGAIEVSGSSVDGF